MASVKESSRLAELFSKPSVEALRALSPGEFRQFVADVFGRAGYSVKSRPFGLVIGGDFDLYAAGNPQKQAGVLAVEADSTGPLSDARIRKLQRAARKADASLYIVSRDNYDRVAHAQVSRAQDTFVIDGEQFCRYVRYIPHSRFPEGTGLTVVIPPDLFATESVPPVTTGRARVLVVANNKGGVGKTVSARQLALNMAEKNLSVLLVDLDPQGNLTEGLVSVGAPALGRTLAQPPHLAQYFAGQCTLSELIRPTYIETHQVHGLHLIPAHPDLSLLDTGGAGRPALEMRFARDLMSLTGAPHMTSDRSFDWVIIDTPPAISLFTRAALCAADFVVVPARSRPSSLSGIQNMLKTLDTMGALRGQPPVLLGCLLTHWSEDQQSTETYPDLEALFDARHSRILAHYIPFDVTVEKVHGPTQHRADNAYDSVTEEVLNHVQHS